MESRRLVAERAGRRWIALIASALAIACGTPPPEAGDIRDARGPVATFAGGGRTVEVVRVLDGDTIDVRIDGTTERVRLLGVDTPERGGGDRPREPLYEDATAFVRAALTSGRIVLVPDAIGDDRDRHGRLLRHAVLDDGTSLAEALLREGLGVAMTQWPYERADAHVAAEAEARDVGRGVWSPDVVLETSWRDAPKHLGRVVAVEGDIVSARCLDSACFLNFHPDYAHNLSAVVLGGDRHRFPDDLDRVYRGTSVRIVGQVTVHRGRPQILLRHPDQITK